MYNSSSSVLVLNRTSPSLLHTFVAYTTHLSISIQHTGIILSYTNTSRVNAFGRPLVIYQLPASFCRFASVPRDPSFSALLFSPEISVKKITFFYSKYVY